MFRICWPEELLFNNKNQFIGYKMKKGFENSVEIYEFTKPSVRNKEFAKFDIKDKNGLQNKLKLILNICIPLHHITSSNNYVMVDFKPQNILTDINGRISILDTDSFQISNNNQILFNARVCTPEYIPKEFANLPPSQVKYNNSTDMFAIAVCFYQILMGVHPYVVRPLQNLVESFPEEWKLL